MYAPQSFDVLKLTSTFISIKSEIKVDALVVGAGFGGIYLFKTMLDQSLKTVLIDTAEDVGGTWWWNRYPGAMSECVETQSPL